MFKYAIMSSFTVSCRIAQSNTQKSNYNKSKYDDTQEFMTIWLMKTGLTQLNMLVRRTFVHVWRLQGALSTQISPFLYCTLLLLRACFLVAQICFHIQISEISLSWPAVYYALFKYFKKRSLNFLWILRKERQTKSIWTNKVHPSNIIKRNHNQVRPANFSCVGWIWANGKHERMKSQLSTVSSLEQRKFELI